MFITYVGEHEVIVTTSEKEEVAIALFFADHTNRKLDDFDRIECSDSCVWIQAGYLRVK